MGFSPFPLQPLMFPSMVVASADDPYGSVGFATQCALAWGGRLVNIGAAGHINGCQCLAALKRRPGASCQAPCVHKKTESEHWLFLRLTARYSGNSCLVVAWSPELNYDFFITSCQQEA
ncbi:RBBP9/YdeN family alpha/beta hydrolase [Acidithiobacillus sp.]